jgi:hypothetical protein
MNYRLFVVAPIALAVSAAFIGAAAGPAVAATVDYCATAPAQLRTLNATAPAAVQGKVSYNINAGIQLCQAGADFEAKKNFSKASKLLGTDLAALGTTQAGTQAAAQ